jgi:hypothetical protein
MQGLGTLELLQLMKQTAVLLLLQGAWGRLDWQRQLEQQRLHQH